MRTSLLLLTLLLASCASDLFEDPPSFSDQPVRHPATNAGGQRSASQETLTPYSDTMTYPADWPEATGRRP